MAGEPIIVVLGPFGGGTSAVAAVLHHLGVFMGRGFDLTYREPYETWEDSRLGALCRAVFSEPDGRLLMDAAVVRQRLDDWAGEHRRAAEDAGRRPGVKHPMLCAAVDLIGQAWGPIVPVVVQRPLDKAVASLNKLGWWTDEQTRRAATAHLIIARDDALVGSTPVRVDFEALRATPEAVIRRLADELGLAVTDTQVQAAVDSIVGPARAGADERSPHEHVRDRLLAKVRDNPDDGWAVFMLAATCFDAGDLTGARHWYGRRAAMGGSAEEVYYAMWRVAESMSRLGEPWPVVQDAYLAAWEFRPSRAEPLHALASQARARKRYRSAYLFAARAATIPLPAEEILFVSSDVYAWRAVDEQAICAFWIGEKAESFRLCRALLARPDIGDADRGRITANRDFAVPAMLQAAAVFAETIAATLLAGAADARVTVSVIAGPDLQRTEATLNSFLNCCTDIDRVGRFLIIDTGLSAPDRAALATRYPFAELSTGHREATGGWAGLRELIGGRYWLHLGQGWQFFAPDPLITRLIGVLECEPSVAAVGVNFADATALTAPCAPQQAIRRTEATGGYLITDTPATGPAMIDTTRLDTTADLAGTASLDEILCIHTDG